MKFRLCPIEGGWIIEAEPRADERGRFLRAWCADEFKAQGIDFVPLQANMGFSTAAGTVRGMHYQAAPHEEAKLVRCTRGALFDVMVDLRPDSATRGQWFGTTLSADNAAMLYVPEGCAHGYQTLEPGTELYYMTSAVYAPKAVRGLRYDDPSVGVAWPLPPQHISEQDRRWPLLESLNLKT